eukprot:TRINITY_DN10653_c0_g1_i1.p1 TRINITY_DN10653_c0_g1~~TRINITY_DN10653_c0_g1_i1.p1  ORF type:complete len:897 (+),score=290.45 TRINITY_DN10653_c0_g1_i1:2325-5015(+)
MMDLISMAKDCTPVLFDRPQQQEKIVESCRQAAQIVFNLKDLCGGERGLADPTALLYCLKRVEEAADRVFQAVNNTNVAKTEKNLFADIQSSVQKLQGQVSLFKIYLSKHRISSSLQEIKHLGEGNTPNHDGLAKMAVATLSTSSPALMGSAPKKGNFLPTSPPNLVIPDEQQNRTGQGPVYEKIYNTPQEIEAYLYVELNLQEDLEVPLPSSIESLKEDLKATPKWLLERTKKEHRMHVEYKKRQEGLESQLKSEKKMLMDWKESAQRSLKETLTRKEEELRAKDLELNRLRSLQRSSSMTNVNHITSSPSTLRHANSSSSNSTASTSSTSLKSSQEQETEIERLKREKLELIQKYNNSISNLESYTAEVENWKVTVTNAYTKRLHTKEAEVKELRDTIELLMRKDEEGREQDDLMNSLLDFINNSSSVGGTNESEEEAVPSSPTQQGGTDRKQRISASMSANALTTLRPKSPSQQDMERPKHSASESAYPTNTAGNLSSNNNNPAWISSIPKKDTIGRSAGKVAASSSSGQQQSQQQQATSVPSSLSKKVFKVLLPNNEGFVSIEYSNEMTLGTVMEIVCSKRALGNPEKWAFQHVNASPQSPFLKLSFTMGSLNVTSIRLVPKVSAPLATSSEENADPNIGMPYLVFHTDHKSVEDLIRMMDDRLVDEKQDEITDGLVSPCKGFDIELGSKKAPNLKNASAKRLVDQDRNTPYYQHYYLNKPHLNFYGESNNRVGPVIISLESPLSQVVDPEVKLRALVRTKYDDEWVFVPNNPKAIKKALLKAMETQCRNGEKLSGIKLQEITHVDGPKDLSSMEQKLMTKGYKFGVLYCKPGQTGWTHYRGGLDVKNDSTGTHSIYTKHCGFEVMFRLCCRTTKRTNSNWRERDNLVTTSA